LARRPCERGIRASSCATSRATAHRTPIGIRRPTTLYGGKDPPRTGASHAAIAPYGPFECGDGELIFLGIQNEREWKRFCEVVLEQPALAGYERFESNSERVENVDALRQAIEGILEQLSSEEAIERLDEAKIANARMRNV
jgi:itaconate CoA-transferase